LGASTDEEKEIGPTSETNITNGCDGESGLQERKISVPAIVELNDGSLKDLVDLNTINTRSQLPQVHNTSDPVRSCPEFNLKGSFNPFRECMFRAISDCEEGGAFGSMSLFLCILRNPVIDQNLLQRAQLCPQLHSKSLRLLSELIDTEEPGHGDLEFGITQVSGESSASFSSSHKSISSSERKKSDMVDATMDPLRYQGSPNNFQREEVGCGDREKGEKQGNTFQTSSSFSGHRHGPLEYPIELVGFLLQMLDTDPTINPSTSQTVPFRLVTYTLMFQLLNELAYDKTLTTCLNAVHCNKLELALKKLGSSVRESLAGALGGFVVDTFEDELVMLQNPNDVMKILDNACVLLSVEPSSATAEQQSRDTPVFPVELRRPQGELEKIRYDIQLFLHVQAAVNQLTQREVKAPYDTFASLLQLTPADPVMKLNSNIYMKDREVLPCTCAVQGQKLKLYLVIDHVMLLLVEKHPTDALSAVLRMLISLRHQEVFQNKNNPCVLHITLRSFSKPHASCRRLRTNDATSPSIPGFHTRDKPLWNLTLLFNDQMQCINAKKHLDSTRESLKSQCIQSMLSFLGNV